MPAEILTDSDDHAVSELLSGQLNTRVHHDTRRQHVAIGHHARAEDLVIVSVSPTETGLRTAATRIAGRPRSARSLRSTQRPPGPPAWEPWRGLK